MSGELETEVTLGDDEFLATVTYTVTGRNRPATHLDPPEYAEIEITDVRIDRDGTTVDVLNELDIKEVERLIQMIADEPPDDPDPEDDDYDDDRADFANPGPREAF